MRERPTFYFTSLLHLMSLNEKNSYKYSHATEKNKTKQTNLKLVVRFLQVQFRVTLMIYSGSYFLKQ